MKVDTMRKIDRWAGMPLCFLVTVFRWLFVRPAAQAPRRILFIELSEMGSTILADPAMRKARTAFGADLYFLIFKRNMASLGFLNTIDADKVVTIREDSLVTLVVDTLRFLWWCRKTGIDTVIDLELFSRFTALLTGLSGAANRVGFHSFHNEGLYRGEMLSHRVAYNPHIHIAKNFVALINALAAPQPEVPYSKTLINDDETTIPQVTVDAALVEDMRGRVRKVYPAFDPASQRIVLFNPNASELLPQRRWSPSHFAALAHQVLERWQDVVILVTGAPAEAAEASALVARVDDPRMVSFAGGCRLTELPALYQLAALMVTNDSGPGHFSSVTAMPTIVLFGPETPALYGSLGNSEAIFAGLACSPCVSAANHRKTACTDPVCMDAIAPERVMVSIANVLEHGSLRP